MKWSRWFGDEQLVTGVVLRCDDKVASVPQDRGNAEVILDPGRLDAGLLAISKLDVRLHDITRVPVLLFGLLCP